MAMADNPTTSSSPLLPQHHHHHHHHQAQEKPQHNSAPKSRNLAEDEGEKEVKEAQPQNITIKQASCTAAVAVAEHGTAINRLSHHVKAHGVLEDTGCRGQEEDVGSGGERGSGGSIAHFNSGVWLQSPAAARKRLSVFKEIWPSKSLGDDHKDDQVDSIIVYSQQDMQDWCHSVLPSSKH